MFSFWSLKGNICVSTVKIGWNEQFLHFLNWNHGRSLCNRPKLERSHCICPFSLWNITLKLTYHLYLVLPDWRFYCKRRDSAGGEWSMEPWPGHPTYTHSRPHRSKFLDMLYILLTFRYFRWICFHPCL